MTQTRRLAVLNAVSFALQLCVAFLTRFKVVNKKDIGEISDQYKSLFTPSSDTFLIWIVIYLSLMAFVIYHVANAWRKESDHPSNIDLVKIGSVFAIINIASAAWLIVWVNNFLPVSVVLIIVQLAGLIIIHQRLKIYDHSRAVADKIFTQFPLGLYLGWITIATIANISTWLTSIHWNGWNVSAINWTITMIALSVLLTVGVINRKKNVAYGVVVLWAFYGILKKRMAVDEETFLPIIWLIQGGLVIVGAACLFGLVRNLRKR
jgi:hypothetical protein